MLGLGETLARRRGLLRVMKSLRGLEDHYRRIVFSVALLRPYRPLARGNRASFLFFVQLGSELSSLPPIFFSGRSS